MRSFFGVHKIVVTPHGQYHVLMHGTTIHGAQKFQNSDGTPVTGRPEPITYYHKDGGIGQAITAIRERKGAPLKVAVIGVGSGTLTCASEPGERLEILRDRPDHGRYRKRPEIFLLHPELRARLQARDRRCAADLRQGARRRLRPHHRRCLFVGCDPDPSCDRRGDGDLQGQARAAGRRGDARLQPASGARKRRRRHCRCQRSQELGL